MPKFEIHDREHRESSKNSPGFVLSNQNHEEKLYSVLSEVMKYSGFESEILSHGVMNNQGTHRHGVKFAVFFFSHSVSLFNK